MVLLMLFESCQICRLLVVRFFSQSCSANLDMIYGPGARQLKNRSPISIHGKFSSNWLQVEDVRIVEWIRAISLQSTLYRHFLFINFGIMLCRSVSLDCNVLMLRYSHMNFTVALTNLDDTVCFDDLCKNFFCRYICKRLSVLGHRV
jgi:hypothetical protein